MIKIKSLYHCLHFSERGRIFYWIGQVKYLILYSYCILSWKDLFCGRSDFSNSCDVHIFLLEHKIKASNLSPNMSFSDNITIFFLSCPKHLDNMFKSTLLRGIMHKSFCKVQSKIYVSDFLNCHWGHIHLMGFLSMSTLSIVHHEQVATSWQKEVVIHTVIYCRRGFLFLFLCFMPDLN